jgi:hypothetical protein
MNYIEHYDEDSGYSFEIPELTLGPDMTPPEEETHAALLSALHSAITMGLSQVPVFAIVGTDSVVSLPREEYAYKLQVCLEYFQSTEEYEICQCLVELHEKLYYF